MTTTADILKKINKDHGSHIAKIATTEYEDTPRIPTSIFALDLAMGGGFPQGRNSIIYGPESSNKTNIWLLAAKSAQMLYPDKKVVLVDAEHALDVKWAAKLTGLDPNRLIVIHPEFAEQAVDFIESFLYANDVSMIGLDSIAALTTQKEIENSAETAAVGGASLLVGKLYRKTQVAFSKMTNQGLIAPAFIAINQIRSKIGVMYGNPECLHADTLVNFVDGRSIPIREVVEHKIDSPLWAFNEDSGEFFESKILSHHYNGEAKDGDFLTVSAQGIDTENGVFVATVTYTHKFLTFAGWKSAGELQVGDLLLTKYRSVISGTLKDFLAGALCGDATLLKPNAGLNCGLEFQDSNNIEYAAWKADLLRPFFNVSGTEGKFVVSPTYELGKFGAQFSDTRHPQGLFNNFSMLGLAVWIMDDACFNRGRYFLSIGRFKDDSVVKSYISEKFDELGFDHRWCEGHVEFTVAASHLIAVNCSPYAPECMAYKFPEGLVAGDYVLHSDEVRQVPTYSEVTSVGPASALKYRDRGLYDLHIEGHHNYLAGSRNNGFVVHNTMPGGNPPKFASSMTVRCYGKNILDKNIDPVMPAFKEVNCIIQKWKVPILATTAAFKMQMIDAGGVPAGTVQDWNTIAAYMKELDYLSKGDKGGWVMSGNEYKTLSECRDELYGNPELLADMKASIIEEMITKGSMGGEASTGELPEET